MRQGREKEKEKGLLKFATPPQVSTFSASIVKVVAAP